MLNLLLQWQHCHQRLVAVTRCTSCCRQSSLLRSEVVPQVLHWNAVTFSLEADSCISVQVGSRGFCMRGGGEE